MRFCLHKPVRTAVGDAGMRIISFFSPLVVFFSLVSSFLFFSCYPFLFFCLVFFIWSFSFFILCPLPRKFISIFGRPPQPSIYPICSNQVALALALALIDVSDNHFDSVVVVVIVLALPKRVTPSNNTTHIRHADIHLSLIHI